MARGNPLVSPIRSTILFGTVTVHRPARRCLAQRSGISGNREMAQGMGAESVLTLRHAICHLPAETARWSTITQIYEGTNQIQRVVMARQLLK